MNRLFSILLSKLRLFFILAFLLSLCTIPGYCQDKNNKVIIIKILIAKIKGELKVSCPRGFTVSEMDGNKTIKVTSERTASFSRDEEKKNSQGDGESQQREKNRNELQPASSIFFNKGTDQEQKLSSSLLISPQEIKDKKKVEESRNLLKINGKRYRGILKVYHKNDYLYLVNELDVEDYLKGVVPKEFQTNYIEMAKAQAVVARTYALGRLGKYQEEGYDFYAGSMFQEYGGYDVEDAVSNRGVEETRGEVLFYNGKLVLYPLYHSTCGGSTACNETVFLTDPIPYLRNVICGEDSKINRDNNNEKDNITPTPAGDNAITSPPLNHNVIKPSPSLDLNQSPSSIEEDYDRPYQEKKKENKNQGRTKKEEQIKESRKTPAQDGKGGQNPPTEDKKNHGVIPQDKTPLPDSDCGMSRYYRWEVLWTKEEMKETLRTNLSWIHLGDIDEITVEKTGECGRIIELKIKGNGKEAVVKGDRIRNILKFKQDKAWLPLYSTRFTIEKQDQGWKAKGSGWGHGLGLCQFGALGMAKKGYDYKTILKKYFKGVDIELYTPSSP